MSTAAYIWPIALVVASNVVYQICAKSIPGDLNPFASLTVTYLVGAAASAEERATPVIRDINGISVAFLAYTESLNDNEKNADASALEYGVNLISKSNAKKDIEDARAAGADVVVCYCSWGEMFNANPTDTEKKIAQALANWGADVIIGYNPHVVQPAVKAAKPMEAAVKNIVFISIFSFHDAPDAHGKTHDVLSRRNGGKRGRIVSVQDGLFPRPHSGLHLHSVRVEEPELILDRQVVPTGIADKDLCLGESRCLAPHHAFLDNDVLRKGPVVHSDHAHAAFTDGNLQSAGGQGLAPCREQGGCRRHKYSYFHFPFSFI